MSSILEEYVKECFKQSKSIDILGKEESRDALLKMVRHTLEIGVNKTVEKALRIGQNLKIAGYAIGFENLVQKYNEHEFY